MEDLDPQLKDINQLQFLNYFGDFKKIENIASFMEDKSKYSSFLEWLAQYNKPIKNFLIVFFSLDLLKSIVNLDYSPESFKYLNLDHSRDTITDYIKGKERKIVDFGSEFVKWINKNEFL